MDTYLYIDECCARNIAFHEECYEGEMRLGPNSDKKSTCTFSVLNLFRVLKRHRSSCGKSITQNAARRGVLL